MTQNSNFARSNILSLNLTDLRLAASEKSLASDFQVHRLLQPWIISPSNQFLLSRQKIGTELLKHCRNGFHLDDPYMHQTRFFVDYHRLHDPALKGYYETTPVKSRLKKLNLTNKNNDAICSNKDFLEYLRYLDKIRSKNVNARRLKKENEFTNRAKERCVNKKYEDHSADDTAHNKHRHVPNLDMYLRREKKGKPELCRYLKKEDKATVRREQSKEEQRLRSSEKGNARKAKFLLQQRKLFEIEYHRKLAIKNKTEHKLMDAEKRKIVMQSEYKITKIMENSNLFKERLEDSEKKYFRNIELYNIYKRHERQRMKKRLEWTDKIQELHEMGMVKIRQQMALRSFKKEQNAELIEKITKALPDLIKKYKTKVNSKHSEEIARRISVLNDEFVRYCVQFVNDIFQKMNFTVSAAEILTQVRRIMIRDIIIIPEFEPIKCVLVRQRLAEFISKMMTDIKNEHLKRIRNERERTNTSAARKMRCARDDSEKLKDVCVAFAVPKDIVELRTSIKFTIREPVKRKSFHEKSQIDKHYDINDNVKVELRQVLLFIIKDELVSLDEFKSRDFNHLYDFQKCYLSKALEGLNYLVKMKQEHDWSKLENAPCAERTKDFDCRIDLEELLFHVADQMMKYKPNIEELIAIMRTLSQYICSEIYRELENDKSESCNKLNVCAGDENDRFSVIGNIEDDYDTK